MRTLYGTVLLVAAVLFLALSRLLRNAQTCACEQTYMYSSYTEVPSFDPRWARHRYKLKLYRETAFSKQGGLDAMWHADSHTCALPPQHHWVQPLLLVKPARSLHIGQSSSADLAHAAAPHSLQRCRPRGCPRCWCQAMRALTNRCV